MACYLACYFAFYLAFYLSIWHSIWQLLSIKKHIFPLYQIVPPNRNHGLVLDLFMKSAGLHKITRGYLMWNGNLQTYYIAVSFLHQPRQVTSWSTHFQFIASHRAPFSDQKSCCLSASPQDWVWFNIVLVVWIPISSFSCCFGSMNPHFRMVFHYVKRSFLIVNPTAELNGWRCWFSLQEPRNVGSSNFGNLWNNVFWD